MVYIVECMANACNPSNGQRSSSGRQTSHARVGGTDERELSGQMVSNDLIQVKSSIVRFLLQDEVAGRATCASEQDMG